MRKAINSIKSYSHLLIYAIVFNIIVVTSVVVIHEEGHFAAGTLLGCRNMRIVLFDSLLGSTYTQMSCSSETNTNLLLLSGFLFTIPLALLLMLLKDFAERQFYLVILGFNLIISSSDIALMARYFSMPLILFGMALIVAGEAFLIDDFLVIKMRKNI